MVVDFNRHCGLLVVSTLLVLFATPGSAAAQLPGAWEGNDIGQPAIAGKVESAMAGAAFTVSGAGVDIWDNSDQFQFMYQAVTGNQEIVARVSDLQAANEWAKAGVMIRAALDGPAAHASIFATGSSGWAFQRRLVTGDVSFHTAGNPGSAPGWVRLVREQNLFSAYWSEDGAQWTLVGADTISMPATIYIGLAVTSHDWEALASATFTNVDVHPVTSTNTPPTVTITSPQAGIDFLEPAAIPISAVAADSDGFVERVDFYNGALLIGANVGRPFSMIWSDIPAGTYTLSAIATDNSGQTATSLPITLTVGAVAPPPLPKPTRVVFVPGADYATNVTSWTVELRRSTDGTTTSPLAIRNLGKPEVYLGEIDVDISPLINPLPSGSYYAVVISTGPGGSTASSASPVFTIP